jgi:anti-sigma B factor antagonist
LRLADVQFNTRGSATVAHVTGEVDLSNAEEIGAAVAEETPIESRALVLDLSDVEYLDSAGIRLIYWIRENMRIRGQALRLVIPEQSPPHDALRLAGVKHYIETAETVDAALAEIT